MLDPLQVKRSSEAQIEGLGGHAATSLPSIGLDELSPRSSAEVALRALGLSVLVNLSFGAPTAVALQWLQVNALRQALSLEELSLLERKEPLEEAQRNRLRWFIESLWAAAWAGGFVDELTPTQPISESLASFFPSLRTNESPRNFLAQYRIRPLEQIYPKLDLFYRAHWYARDCHLMGKDCTPFNPGVVQYRRQFLEWVTHADAEWEDVDLCT